MTSVTASNSPTSTTDRSPARPGDSAVTRWHPVGLDAAGITDGFWFDRQQANGQNAIPAGLERLEEAGNLQNFRVAAGQTDGEAIGPIFADSDVYKWLESVAWEYARQPTEPLLEMQRTVTALIAAAQAEDGYLDTVVQIRHREQGRYFDLPWSHEHYCAGHLMQAAVAQVRCTGDRELLDVAIRLADHLVATFGDDKRHDIDGHPVIEMGLAELYRETGHADYLELARYFVEARGHGLMEKYGRHPAYFSDRLPVRDATTVEGHSVRAVYLGAGAADVAVERDDQELLTALSGQFAHMWSTKTYLTGGLGARWEGEAFGEPYELPPDRAYAETCAAIGGVQWAWRMLLATGEAHYADAIERMLFNGFLAGVSLSGDAYFYVNPLRVRGGASTDGDRAPANGRLGWFTCACCPPNVMRTLASLAGYLASTDQQGLQIHQYATGAVSGGGLSVDVQTDYPWNGDVKINITTVESTSAVLSLRIPGWAAGATVSVAGERQSVEPGGYAALDRDWQVGDEVILSLPLDPRVIAADPRVDAVAGSVAIESGPLVYALEQVDQSDGVLVDDALLPPDAATRVEYRADLLGGVSIVRAGGAVRTAAATDGWPYPAAQDLPDETVQEAELIAVPYYAWANREVGAMRVWVPTTS